MIITADPVTLEGLSVRGFRNDGVALSGFNGFRLAHIVADQTVPAAFFRTRATDDVIAHRTVSGHNDVGSARANRPVYWSSITPPRQRRGLMRALGG